MNTEIRWFDPEETILYHRFSGEWSWDVFYTAVQEGRDLFTAKAYRVDFIVDIRLLTAFPNDIISKSYTFFATRPVNAGQVVLVGGNRLIRIIGNTLTRLFATSITFAESVESAQTVILRLRARAVIL